MATVQRRSTIDTRVDAGVAWLTPRQREHADLDVLRLDILAALSSLVDDPDIQTIVCAGFPAAILEGSTTDGSSDADAMLIEQCHRLIEQLWRSSKTLTVRRAADHSAAPDAPAYIEPLTPRERQVLSMVSQWVSARDIAARLFISERTVESHVSNGYRKLGICSRIELARRAAEFGL